MTRSSLERSLHILGPVLGRQRGVEVCIGGRQACTDGQTIWLPALPIDDTEAAQLGFGLLFHETNHVRYTDFALARGEGLAGALTNVLEDVRVDALGQQAYRGGRQEEEDLVAALVRRGEAKSSREGDHPAHILETYVMWRLERDVLGIDAARSMAEQAERVLRKTFAPAVQIKLDALMFGVRDCRSTREACALAHVIAAMLEETARAADAPALGDEGKAQDEDPNASAPRQALDAQPSDHASGIGELAQAAVNAKGREAGASNLRLPRGAPSRVAPSVADAAAFALEAGAAVNALRQRLAGLLQAEALCRHYPAMTGRRIDARRIGRIEAGEQRLFRREAAGCTTDTAVQILVDRSGSMGARRGRHTACASRPIEVARAACYAATRALNDLPGVAVAAAAFPGRGESEIAVLVQFGERVDRQKARFASLEAGGGTPLAESMLWAAGELLRRRTVRRILLVATDGAYDQGLARAMTSRLGEAGIEALGIGVLCEVSHLFARSRSIAAIDALPQAMFELLLDTLAPSLRAAGAGRVSPSLSRYGRA